MTSASSSQAFVQLTSSEEGNWLSLGRALTTVLCQGLRPFVKKETEAFYNIIKAATTSAGPCTCVYVPRRKPNQYHDMSTCQWANILQVYHYGNKPNWKQSDPTKWMDPNVGPWEIAKLFLPDIGGHTVIQSVEDMEISAILNLMFWCNHFTVQRLLIKDVRDTRNTKWAHVSKLELSEAEKKGAFETIEKFLQDPALVWDVDAQEALREILALKCTSDVHIFKAELLSHFKEAIQNELKSLKRESKRNKKQRSRVDGQLRNLQKALDNVEKKQKASISVPRLIINRTVYVVSYLVKSARGIRRKSVGTLLMFLFLCCLVGVLDHKSYRDGELRFPLYYRVLGGPKWPISMIRVTTCHMYSQNNPVSVTQNYRQKNSCTGKMKIKLKIMLLIVMMWQNEELDAILIFRNNLFRV